MKHENLGLKGKSLITLEEFSPEQIDYVLNLAIQFKNRKKERIFEEKLSKRNIALVFLKPSCRTRTSFVVAASDEGAILQIFPKEDIRFGIKESVKDIARVLGRLFDGIAFRGDQETLEEIAEFAGIPVWNGLSESHHPTQVLADLMTVKENFGKIEGTTLAFVGDGASNMVTSLSIIALKLGFHFRVVTPESRTPNMQALEKIKKTMPNSKGSISVTNDILEGVKGAEIIYGDIWISMGQEESARELISQLKPYKITQELMNSTGNPRSIFLHCLPALHDDRTEFARKYPDACDVTDDVFESANSLVFDQAENRMHTIKAIMVATINGE